MSKQKCKKHSNCPYCGIDLSNMLRNLVGSHVRWCDKNPKNNSINSVNWEEIQKAHDSGVYWNNLRKMFSISRNLLEKGLNSGFLKKTLHKVIFSDNTKKKISEMRKKFLSENKDKHVWKRNEKFKSLPCEEFKKILSENSINFIEEYSPISSNNFSIDVAFPDKKIAIEINGNQHYNHDKTLKYYYANRQRILEENGWIVFQIHYSLVYKKEFIIEFIKKLKSDFELKNIDYSFYLKSDKVDHLCECGSIIKTKSSRYCVNCSRKKSRRVVRPDLEQLLLDVRIFGYRATGRKYGVSDNSIRKWIKSLNN